MAITKQNIERKSGCGIFNDCFNTHKMPLNPKYFLSLPNILMKKIMHTTNYTNTFIEVAEDCSTQQAEIPPQKGDNKTVANIHFDIVAHNPYKFTSDDVIFQAFALKNALNPSELDTERAAFFLKGQPCMRCSPLTKRYGWGVHNNEEGKIAIFPKESVEYQQFAKDENLKHVKAMRSKRG